MASGWWVSIRDDTFFKHTAFFCLPRASRVPQSIGASGDCITMKPMPRVVG